MPSSKRAVSPVLATIIIASVAITLAVAVSFFLSGTVIGSTSFEVLEIVSARCVLNGTNWVIDVIVKNVGSNSGTLVQALVNGLEVNNYASPYITDQWSTNMSQSQVLRSGEKVMVRFFLDPDRVDTSLSSGTSVELMLHSASGYDYPVLIILV
jgi:hypothetical protein